MKRSLKMFLYIVTIIIVIIVIGSFTFLKPEPSKMIEKKKTDKAKLTNITNVGRFSDSDGSANISSSWFSKVIGGFSTARNRTSSTSRYIDRSLPYPRVMINYSIDIKREIRNESAGDKSRFLILTLDIRNYGYKYFDAHPSKFRIAMGKVEPLVNVSTGNMLDVVIPNNSRAKGDLVFLLSEKGAYARPNIQYTQKNYTVLYNRISLTEMNRVEKDEEEEEKVDYYDYYGKSNK